MQPCIFLTILHFSYYTCESSLVKIFSVLVLKYRIFCKGHLKQAGSMFYSSRHIRLAFFVRLLLPADWKGSKRDGREKVRLLGDCLYYCEYNFCGQCKSRRPLSYDIVFERVFSQEHRNLTRRHLRFQWQHRRKIYVAQKRCNKHKTKC